MPSTIAVANLKQAVEQRLFPTVTTFNRLEGRPRTVSFERALRAEVRDALWMLSKQWQMGEFRGADAGSPVFAKLQIDTTRLTKYRPDGAAAGPFDYGVPLEATVEQRRVPLTLDLRLLMGGRWLAFIQPIGYRQEFIDGYSIPAPDPTKKADAERVAHAEVWQTLAAVSGHAMDGGALYVYLTGAPGRHAYDGIAVANADKGPIDTAAGRWLAWFRRLLLQPPARSEDAWIPERMEYQFAASAPVPAGEKVYAADEYYSGRLDWYSVDVAAAAPALDPVPGSDVTGLPPATPHTTIPVPVSFAGMPNTRWWAFEDQKTNFGDIDAATTDLAKLLFMEFALVYSNDWFVIPFTLPNGAIATIRGCVVTNVFGERFWIDAADRGPDAAWQRWSLFTVNVEGGEPDASADTSLLLLPTLPKIQESALTEEILLVRDEAANMVWGIESVVPLLTGDTKPGLESARETRAFYEGLLAAAPPPPPAAATIRYRVMTTVPENWIPFIPVHVPGSNRRIQLQRAALPRIIAGDPDPPIKVQPKTVLLREGLDQDPAQPYFLYEEEVPRAGTRATQSFQRARWTGGAVYTWLRVRKQTGRGEGQSGLAFDRIVAVPQRS